jgi:membrane protease YdiL (CAAX protease family)
MTVWQSMLIITVAVAVPVEAFVTLRRDRVALRQDRLEDRGAFFIWTLLVLWSSAALGVGLSVLSGASLGHIGLGTGRSDGQALVAWAMSISLSLLALGQWIGVRQSSRLRRRFRARYQDIGDLQAYLPSTPSEQALFNWVGLSAGLTEEVIFRGVLIWALGLTMPLWLAAGLSLLLFVALHRYQGTSGMFRVGVLGLLLTVIVLMSGSLWPAMLLHASVDIFNGLVLWRLRPATGVE